MRMYRSGYVLLLLSFFLATQSPVVAATYTVTSTNDNVGAGTLRWAITQANGLAGKDTIEFGILPWHAITRIQPLSALPRITNSVIIDGTTQSGDSCVPGIELNGLLSGGFHSGLWIASSNCEVRGFIINEFSRSGIWLDGGSGNIIEGNYIGTDINGVLDRGNALNGIEILSSSENIIGRPPVAECGGRNIISGNGYSGIYISGSAAVSNCLRNNYIGTDVSGTFAIPNDRHGVEVNGSVSNIIGDDVSAPLPANVISGNRTNGLDRNESIGQRG